MLHCRQKRKPLRQRALTRPLQSIIQKCADSAQGLVGGVQVPNAVDEPVWHSRPYVELGVDAGSNGPLHVASRVVEQHFIISHVEADWGQPGKISIKWRRQGIFGIALAQVGTREARGLGPHEVRVRFGSGFETFAGKREVCYWG